MRVAVTGATGFLGASTCRQLRDKGHDVVEIDRAHGHDVTSHATIAYLGRNADAVIHLAGVLGTAELFDDPSQAVDVNIGGALNVLQACRHHGLRYVGIAMPECWPNVYQATKLAAKKLATAWHLNFGVPVCHVRAFNAYGPGQKYGPGHPQKIIPTFAVRGWQNKPIPVWGDGSQLVDLIHVDDIGRMLIDGLRFGDDETFDAGTGRPMSVLEVANKVIEVTGSKAGIEFLPMRKGETPTKVTYARGEGWPLLDWRPEHDAVLLEECIVGYREIAAKAKAYAA